MNRILLAVLLAVLCTGCFESTGTISGRISDGYGNYAAGASVITNPLGLTATADQNGYYTINDVPWGDYTVTATLGQLSNSTDVTLVNSSYLSCIDININPSDRASPQTDIMVGAAVSRPPPHHIAGYLHLRPPLEQRHFLPRGNRQRLIAAN